MTLRAHRRLFASLAVLPIFTAAAASAAGSDDVAALLQEVSFDGARGPALVREAPAAAPTPPAVPAPAAPALIPASLWDSAPPLDAAARGLLSARLPALDLATVRELPFSAVDPILAEAARRGDNCLDVFSDEGLRGKAVYYLSAETVARVFTKYVIKSLTPASGNDDRGRPFRLIAIVMGAGRLELLYDRDGFTYANADFPDHRYSAKGRISERIDGPGDMTVDGLGVAMLFHPKIERFVELSPTSVRVETSLGGKNAALFPIRPR